MTSIKKHFLFNYEWAEVLMDYPAEVRLEVYDAIIRYAQSGTLSELKPQAKMAFSFIKREIDYNESQYQNIVDARKAAGSKGGKAKQSKQTVAKQANATFPKQTKQHQANGSIYDNVNDKNNNSEDKSSSSPSIPQTGGGGDDDKDKSTDFDVLRNTVDEYKSKTIWRESIKMQFAITDAEVDKALEDFFLDMRCKEIKVYNFPAFFTRWLTDRRNGQTKHDTNAQQRSAESNRGNAGVPIKGKVNSFGYGLIE